MIKVLRCARCGEDHKITFHQMKGRPLEVDSVTLEGVDGEIYQARPARLVEWGVCGNTGGLVLVWQDFKILEGDEVPEGPVQREVG